MTDFSMRRKPVYQQFLSPLSSAEPADFEFLRFVVRQDIVEFSIPERISI